MKRIMFHSFFNLEKKSILGAAGVLAVFSLISRVLGLIRDRLLAGSFGTGEEIDVYFAAFRIPDFIYNILIAGGIVVVFIPLFSEFFIKDKKEAWEFVSNVLNIFLVFLFFASVLMIIFAPFLVKIIAPGFSDYQVNLCVLLTRILFLSPILLGISSIFSGILQYFQKFFIYGLAPVFYNLGIIFGIIFLVPLFGVLGVAFGVIIGAFLHLSLQIPFSFTSGFSWKPIFRLKDEKIKRILLLMIPRTFGVAAPQINLMVTTAIASVLPVGAVSVFNFANNLQQFPMGLIGIPFAIAVFPVLSKAWAEGKKDEFFDKFSLTFKKVLYLSILISIFIFIFRDLIIKIILKTGKFGETAFSLTSASLGLFVFGIFASCLIPLIFRAFFALQNTKTPTIITIITVIINIFLSFTFVWLLSFSNFFENFIINIFYLKDVDNVAVLGLPLAFSVSAILQFLFLYKALKNKIKANS